MKKALLIMLLAVLSVGLAYGYADAGISGQCANCHTMHNSQGGTSQARVYSGGTIVTTDFGQELLLSGDCLGCHSQASGTTTITTDNKPVVWNVAANPTSPLAGGNFRYVSNGPANSKGHNVKDIVAAESLAPPGFAQATMPTEFVRAGTGTWGPATWAAGTQVTCAGMQGCHGDRSQGYDDTQGIRGAHHGDDSTIDGTSIAQSYRFLAGIKGAEVNTPTQYRWEQTTATTAHNGYEGAVSGGDSDNTISYLCQQCHAKFHKSGGTSNLGTQSPWLRHPTDVVLAVSGGGDFTTDYTTYSTETPVAYTSPATTTSAVDTNSIVMCLSCHRAHATAEDDALRWTYTNINAGDSVNDGGCERCHQKQR